MTNVRGLLITVTALALGLGACDKKKGDEKPRSAALEDKGSAGPGSAADPGGATMPPPVDIKGPAITPVVTGQSVTFVVPKQVVWWGEMTFACYAAAVTLQPGNRPGQPFEQVSPMVPVAMAAADINLDTDLAAIGGFECGESPCFYIAATLRSPNKIKDALAKVVPGGAPVDHGNGHYAVETQGMKGPRTVNVRVLPIKWGAPPPADDWAKTATKATHVIFVIGVDGKNKDIDPLPLLADATEGAARVKDTESLVTDAHGRCIVGHTGPSDFKPGYKLDKARFAMAAPPGAGDPLTKLVGSNRTLALEIELTLTPAAKDADVKKWIQEGKAWASQTAAPIKAQFAGQGPMVEALMDMFALIGERGFKSQINGKALRLSWRTDRVPQSDLDAIEARLQKLVGTP